MLILGIVLLALAGILSAVLSGVASAAPEPPSPALPTGPAQYPADPLHPDAPPLPKKDAPTGDDLVKETQKREKKEAEDQEKAWNRLVAKYRAGHEGRGGILDSFKVKDASGKLLPVSDADGNPISSYRIYADSGDWKQWDLKIEAFLVEACFTGIKFLVGFACFLISWALSFFLAGILLKPALRVSDSLYGSVLVQMGVPGLALTFAVTVAAWQLMLGNRSRGWGNLLASMVISALAVGALASPPEFLLSKDTGAVATARNLAVETAALVLEKEAIDTDRSSKGDVAATGAQVRLSPEALARPITDALVDSLVARPAMMLSYGRTFDGNCGKEFRKSRLKQAIFDEVLDAQIDHGDKVGTEALPLIGKPLQNFFESTGIHVTPDFFREMRKGKTPIAAFEEKCVPDAAAVKQASMDKVLSAAFMLLAAAIICLFVLFLDFGFLVAQVQISLEAMLAKVALVAGVLPGDGRAWLWTRAASIARSLALMVVSVLSLAVVIVLINAITTASEEDIPGGITIRFVLLDGVCIAAFVFRKRLVRSTRAAADRARTRLGSTVLGGASTPDTGPVQRRRSPVGALLAGGLMAAAALGTGGTSAAAGLGLSRMGTARAGIRLGGAALRAGTATAKGLGRAAGTTMAAGTRLGVRAGSVALKSSIGLPVYGPRAARQVRAGARALPGRIVQQVNTVAHQAHTARVRARAATAPARAFVGEYRHNIRSLGRVMRGQGGLGPYNPPTPTPSAPRRRTAPPPARSHPRPQASRKLSAASSTAPTPRPRLAPPRSTAHERPQSAAQGMLQARRHRSQARRATSPPPPSAAAPRRDLPPAAPRRPRS
ncbi:MULTISPECIES: hypothetical protein [unclassified Streptomyces]|uniref:hypothetical protein n=1 Tax=unclassified Streptomyces TaxID=2593676 RepID=UPI000BAC996F|nr:MULTISPECIES: hypothetical protein [unclassified Streptomyces]ASY36987.1 hypothetical protein CAC01_30575 [Streptomyces sp. CLI2509]MYX19774.1 hypothetical protein [Streptomyces sp. SID8380]